MNNLTALRTEFLDFCDNADILEHIQQRCQQKGIAAIAGLDDCQVLYQQRALAFEAQVNAGQKTTLPPNNVWLLLLESMRDKLPSGDINFNDLSIIVEFDEQENLGIKYIVNQVESIEDWVARHPELDIDSVRGVFDSYLLEYFDQQKLLVDDNKLFTKTGRHLVGFQNFQRDEKLKNFVGLSEKISNSGLVKNVNISATTKVMPEARPESQQL